MLKSTIDLSTAGAPSSKCGRCGHELVVTGIQNLEVQARATLLLGWLNGHKCVRAEDEE